MVKASLQDVLDEMVSQPERWPARSYPKIIDALKRLARLMNCKLAELPACPSSIDGIIGQSLHWRSAGFSTEAAFRDFKGRIKRAIRQTTAGREGVPTYTATGDLSPAWQALMADIDAAVRVKEASVWMRRSIAHLVGYANAIGKEPGEVDSVVANDLVRHHAQSPAGTTGIYRVKASVRTWNRLIEIKGAAPQWLRHFPVGLSPIFLESRIKRINPAEATWPASLRADIDTLMARRCSSQTASNTEGPDRFAVLLSSRSPASADESGKVPWRRRRIALAARTVAKDRRTLCQSVGALVRAGKPLSSITSLDDVLNLKAIAISLADYETRLHSDIPLSKRPASQWHLASELGVLYRLWQDPSKEELETLIALRSACHTESCGTMSLGRKKALWQFDDPANLLAWFNRPDELVRRAEANRRRGRIGPHDITDIEIAILCRLVSVLPARRANLCTIRITGEDRHLVLGRHAREPSWIIWPANEVKNRRVLRAEVDSRTAALIRLYIEHYRPAFLERTKTPDSPALFPGDTDDRYGKGHRAISTLGLNFSARMKEAGLKMTLHLARHLAARIVLDVDPSMMALVADLLGDKITTVSEYYVDGQTARASAAYRKVLAERARELNLKWEAGNA